MASLDTDDAWIVSHTGIHQRHIAAAEESSATMGAEAARRALAVAGVPATSLGMILCSTCTADYSNFPSTAALIQAAVGADGVSSLDLNTACSCFPYALSIGKQMCLAYQKPVLLVASEAVSRILDWHDRSTCILFGDGAAAVVLEPAEDDVSLYGCLGADGPSGGVIRRDAGARRMPEAQTTPAYIEMQGRVVFPFAVRTMERIIRQILDANHLALDDIQYIVPHQANLRILDAVARHMGVPIDRFYVNIGTVANTSSAAVPIALDELFRAGRLRRGDLILTVAFGAGLTYGGNLLRWQMDPPRHATSV